MTIDLKRLEQDPSWSGFVRWARRIGGGFHPDTRGADYVPPLAPDEVADYDASMELAFGGGSDPYEVGMAVFDEAYPDLAERRRTRD